MVAGRERRDEFDYESASEVQDRIELAACGYFDEWRDLDSQDLYEDTGAWRDLRTVYPIDTPDTELFFSEEAEDDDKDIDSGISGENTKSPSRAEQAGHVWDDSLEGDPFPNIWLRTLWGGHRSKLDVVYEFLIDEEYWFGTGPSDPEENRQLLAIVEAWSKNLNAYKQQGFYVDLRPDGSVSAPSEHDDAGETLLLVLDKLHQIGWQLRLGEHIEGKNQDDMANIWARYGDRLSNEAYRLNPCGEPLLPGLSALGKKGYEAQTRELMETMKDAEVPSPEGHSNRNRN